VDMISFGPVFLELVFGHVPALPLPGEEVFTDEFAISCGGAVTSASAAARGGARAGLCALLGNDLGSQIVIEHSARAGVDLSPSLRVRRRCAGISVVLNFEGDRAFVTHVPPQPASEQPETGRWRAVLRQHRPRWCYLHAGMGVPAVLREARELGTRVVLDTSIGDERHRDLVIECVRLADVFVPNEEELRRLTGAASTGEAVAAAACWGTPLVVKRGAAGALVAGPGGVTEVVAGVRRVTVRDLTGAGDAFAGALIAGLVSGATLADAVVAANTAGSEAVARLGASGEVGVPGISTAERTVGSMFVARMAMAARRAGGRAAEKRECPGEDAAPASSRAGAGEKPAGHSRGIQEPGR
jgi:sugar/nucleoside kinase (ribokinase family)